jgi:hypothetical protein
MLQLRHVHDLSHTYMPAPPGRAIIEWGYDIESKNRLNSNASEWGGKFVAL